MSRVHIASVHPSHAIPGARITLTGAFAVDGTRLPEVTVQGQPARIVLATDDRLSILVPAGIAESGPSRVRVASDGHADAVVNIAAPIATGLHQVDNPAIDRAGNLYLTYSGTRGQEVPVSIFRVGPNGTREAFSSGIVNPTSLAFDAAGRLYASSRFEGLVYRLEADGTAEVFATELGVACGLAFGPDGTLFVGDRSGTIFAVDRLGHATPLATLPSSVAAFHLAISPDALYVSGPTLSTSDQIYRVGFDGRVEVFADGFGRPQGLTFGPDGGLYVIEALAGASGVYRLRRNGDRTLILAGAGLVGLAFDASGALIVCSNDTAYRLPAAA